MDMLLVFCECWLHTGSQLGVDGVGLSSDHVTFLRLLFQDISCLATCQFCFTSNLALTELHETLLYMTAITIKVDRIGSIKFITT